MKLLEVASIIKPHGLKGEVVVSLVTNREERVAPGTVLTVALRSPRGTDGANLAPLPSELTVASSRRHKGRFLVHFVEVTSIDVAEKFRGAVLSAAPLSDGTALFVHELIGKRVIDTEGIDHGVVTAVEANPASDLLVVDDRFYVPVRFVVEHDTNVVVDVPEGLFA